MVADGDLVEVTRTMNLLSRVGYQARGASTFGQARRRLAVEPPDLLIADIRLGMFNGLHLLIDQMEMPAIITHALPDSVLEAEATRHGATFLLKPATPSVLLQVVSDVLAVGSPRRSIRVRRWARTDVSAGLPARIGQAQAKVLDVGYGGCGLSCRSRRQVRYHHGSRLAYPRWGWWSRPPSHGRAAADARAADSGVVLPSARPVRRDPVPGKRLSMQPATDPFRRASRARGSESQTPNSDPSG